MASSDDDWRLARVAVDSNSSDDDWRAVAAEGRVADDRSTSLNCQELPQVLCGPSKVAELLLDPPAGLATLSSSKVFAEDAGIQESKVAQKIFATVQAGYTRVRSWIDGFVTGAFRYRGRPESEAADATPSLYYRVRRYDTTPSRKLRATSVQEVAGIEFVDEDTMPGLKVFAMESLWCLVVRQVSGLSSKCLHLWGRVPVKLQFLQRGRGEDHHGCIYEADLPFDALADERHLRFVEGICTDDDGACERGEQIWSDEHPLRASLKVKCTAHKKSAVNKTTMAVVSPFDTLCVRLLLTIRNTPQGTATLKQVARQVIVDQFVSLVDGSISVADSEHRDAVYNLYLPCPAETAREAEVCVLIRSLFNGRIHRAGVVEHVETGCCSSPRHTLTLMITKGVDALFPRSYGIWNRADWTGSSDVLKRIGLPTSVHSIFQATVVTILKKEMMHRPQDQVLQVTDGAPEQAHPDDISCMTSGADLTKEMDVNGVPCSLFAESRPFQVQATRDWLLQGTMGLDIAVVTIVATEFDRLMLRGLKLGTKTWEAA